VRIRTAAEIGPVVKVARRQHGRTQAQLAQAIGASRKWIVDLEERGSGIDRAVEAIELAQQPAPEISVMGDHTRVTLLGPRPLAQVTQRDRMRACYQHASMASRIIAEAVEARMIKPFDPENESRKHARYVPIWAVV
jgi:DNA-binding XRE family transcriptional regulator